MVRYPTIRIDVSSTVPAYTQIENAIRVCLVEGELRPGMRLPPVRQLAVNLGVHHNTVAEAYRRLAREGWLELRRQRGAIVRQRAPGVAPKAAQETFICQLRELVAKAQAQGVAPSLIRNAFARLVGKLEGSQP